ncbi:aldo/keto reductase [Geminisphaera colitermitum]|uniref:aldo/keto reductase n=1 Tax=Geminisphaera colitermitum TaxID=1148786 RepID=UPI0001965448|nr:aldo/keto reductase [Geminisphaera colitermitum]
MITNASPATSSSLTASVTPLRWGILGAGRISGIFARGVTASRLGRLAAVGSRSVETAARFAAGHAIPAEHAHGSYEALLADAEVDAIYIGTPHPQHAEWAIRAAEAGKHVLCEKPLGLNHAEGMAMVQAARENGVVLMEAFMYRCHPQTARIVELIREGVLGDVRVVQATFSFRKPFDADSRLWSNAAGGGGILDVGCYPVSFARLIAGAVCGKPFLNPVKITGGARLHPQTGVDEYAAATLEFPNGVLAQVASGVGVAQDNAARIYGSAGWLHVPAPWGGVREGGVSKMYLHRAGAAEAEELAVEAGPAYALEADAFAEAVRATASTGVRDGREVPAMTLDDSLGNLEALDQWRAAIGLVYEQEKPENLSHTVARRPLQVRAAEPIPRAPLPGVDKPVSLIVMCGDQRRAMPHAAAMWDDFFERGGNAFDTAHLHADGVTERLLGQWIRHRGVRDQVVVVGKSGHSAACTPEDVSRNLFQSLDRLGTNRIDVYLIHRDNPAVPVGEFVDVLNQHIRAGHIRVFGGFNWRRERIEAANEYARTRRLQGIGVWSNQFSLARMMEPLWEGCLSVSDRASRQWLTSTPIPLFAWSSQARGFFTDRAGREKRTDADLVRCWYSDDNFARRERAAELAKKKGVSLLAIAGAYVLEQPFPSFTFIRPQTIAETAAALECLKVKLSADELAWLNLEQD